MTWFHAVCMLTNGHCGWTILFVVGEVVDIESLTFTSKCPVGIHSTVLIAFVVNWFHQGNILSANVYIDAILRSLWLWAAVDSQYSCWISVVFMVIVMVSITSGINYKHFATAFRLHIRVSRSSQCQIKLTYWVILFLNCHLISTMVEAL